LSLHYFKKNENGAQAYVHTRVLTRKILPHTLQTVGMRIII
jgi:hypothetical protein